MLNVGQSLPDVTLVDHRGARVKLRDLTGATLVVYVYPEADTPSCTKEACAFNDALKDFEKLGVKVVGISPDGPAKLAKFAAKYKLGFTLLGDEPVDGVPKGLASLGCWGEKSMYGRTYMGVLRTTFLVNPDGTVKQRWDRVRVPGHAEEVAAAIGGDEAASVPSQKLAPKKPKRAASAKKLKTTVQTKLRKTKISAPLGAARPKKR